MLLYRIHGLPLCYKMYTRLSFSSTREIARLKALIVRGDSFTFLVPDRAAGEERPPNSFLVKTYINAVKRIVEDLGETMPHQHDTNPLDASDRRARVYIPSGLASSVIDLTRSLLRRGQLPDICTPATLEYLAEDIFPKYVAHV